MSDKKAAAEAPGKKKSRKTLLIIVIALLVLGGGGGGAYFVLFGGSAQAAVEPAKGVVVPMEEALTINLADGHYLKLGFALQATEEAGKVEIDLAEAIDAAIDQYTGMEIAVLETEKGRQAAKAALLEKIKKIYNVDDADIIMDIYYTQFVTQ